MNVLKNEKEGVGSQKEVYLKFSQAEGNVKALLITCERSLLMVYMKKINKDLWAMLVS